MQKQVQTYINDTGIEYIKNEDEIVQKVLQLKNLTSPRSLLRKKRNFEILPIEFVKPATAEEYETIRILYITVVCVMIFLGSVFVYNAVTVQTVLWKILRERLKLSFVLGLTYFGLPVFYAI